MKPSMSSAGTPIARSSLPSPLKSPVTWAFAALASSSVAPRSRRTTISLRRVMDASSLWMLGVYRPNRSEATSESSGSVTPNIPRPMAAVLMEKKCHWTSRGLRDSPWGRSDRGLRTSAPKRPPSMSAGQLALTGFEEEPGSPLGLVDPDFDEARGRDVAVLVANIVNLAQTGCERLVVIAQFSQHVQGLDILGIVVLDALKPADVANRLDRGPADLADSLGDGIGHGQ